MNTYSLERFVHAQQFHYAQALAELHAGRKQTHWMWYVLPQLLSLGRSQKAHYYGIANRAEAAAYLAHPLLGPRLIEYVRAILEHRDRSIIDILGRTDGMKLQSCLTLFRAVAPSEPIFGSALHAFYEGHEDEQRLRLLATTAV